MPVIVPVILPPEKQGEPVNEAVPLMLLPLCVRFADSVPKTKRNSPETHVPVHVPLNAFCGGAPSLSEKVPLSPLGAHVPPRRTYVPVMNTPVASRVAMMETVCPAPTEIVADTASPLIVPNRLPPVKHGDPTNVTVPVRPVPA